MLDIGAGSGLFAMTMRELGVDVTLLDHPATDGDSPWLPDVSYVDVETQPLPFPSGSFSLVTCFDVLEHLHNSPRPLLSEINRVLGPGGALYVQVPNLVNLRKRLWVAMGRPNHVPIEQLYGWRFPYTGHVREYTRSDLRYVIERSGFRVEEDRPVNDFLWMTPVEGECSDGARQHLRRHASTFRLNSLRQWLKLAYWPFVAAVPGFRDTLTMVARKT